MAWLKTFASAAVYATLIVTFGFQVARVEGRSMEPTLADQDRLIVNKALFRFRGVSILGRDLCPVCRLPKPGDLVMLFYPKDPDKSFVKRVVAVPGDTVTIDAPARKLQLEVDEEELRRRRTAWEPPAPRYSRGVLAKYARLVSSADRGAVTDLELE